jgi:hypothetical protein
MLKRVKYWIRRNVPALRKENITRNLRTRTAFRFIDRQRGHKHLLLVIAGYKRPLWPYFFDRLERFLPSNIDVCIVCPGFTEHPDLEKKCQDEDWSILLCYQNKISKAKNVAILNHPKAQLIYKIDEDIMITERFFEGMATLFRQADENPEFHLGYVAPLLNVNGYSYHRLLDLRDQKKRYESRFGPATSACVGIEAWSNGEAAEFLWDIIEPLDESATALYQNGERYTICPHRFSIGAFLFPRSLWENLNYFKHGDEAYLGMEEVQLAEYCAREALQVVVSDEILVGHFSFGPQYHRMLEKLTKDDSFLKLGTKLSEPASSHPLPV